MIIEACVETLDQSVLAEQLGADQLELCARLDLGGISPSYTLIKSVLDHVNIPVKIMLRPRGGSFIYTDKEILLMQKEVELHSTLAIDGFVFGCLNKEHQPDIKQTKMICSWVHGKSLTFHKAIDDCTDIFSALKELEQTDVEFILSSGGKLTAAAGAETLARMQDLSTLKIIAAGKITKDNLTAIAKKTRLNYFHGRKIVGRLDI